MGLNMAQNEFFAIFLSLNHKFTLKLYTMIVFFEITDDEQSLTSSRGKAHGKNVEGQSLGQMGQNWAQN